MPLTERIRSRRTSPGVGGAAAVGTRLTRIGGSPPLEFDIPSPDQIVPRKREEPLAIYSHAVPARVVGPLGDTTDHAHVLPTVGSEQWMNHPMGLVANML